MQQCLLACFGWSVGAATVLAAMIGLAGSGDSAVGSSERWRLEPAREAIVWDVAHDSRLPHQDRVELSGRRTSAIVTYAVDDQRRLQLTRTLIWPALRLHPNDTRGFLKLDFTRAHPPAGKAPMAPEGTTWFEPRVRVDGDTVEPKVREVRFESGVLKITSDLGGKLTLEQTVTPAVELEGYFEVWLIHAEAPDRQHQVEITPVAYSSRLPYQYTDKGFYHYGQPRPEPVSRKGNYLVTISCHGAAGEAAAGANGKVCVAEVAYHAWADQAPASVGNAEDALTQRRALAAQLFNGLRLECPDPVVTTLFDYSKLRASDSICETVGGPLHAPGGGDYYAAIWANDTIEYVAPFFPFLGYAYGNAASLNALDHYARYLNPQYDPLPSSIIAGGTDIWARRLRPDGLPDAYGDCGDAAMLAYGGSRFLLALGDPELGRKHWPLIEWSLEYCRRRETPEGVIASASDELEGRFSSGKFNLNTSMLTYGGLVSGADLAQALGKPGLAREYRQRAQALRTAADRYFGAEISGFHTYQYHEGCRELRAWIGMPLAMGVDDRKAGTVNALFSPRLWCENGLLTAENATTYWDRSALYALRGAFHANEADAALRHLQALSRRRLLGEHVPYVIEAFPEGNGRHLSGESALFCRVITEGLFGLTPRGFRKFSLQPGFPAAWEHAALRRFKAFQNTFDVEISRAKEGQYKLRVAPEGGAAMEKTVKPGESADFEL